MCHSMYSVAGGRREERLMVGKGHAKVENKTVIDLVCTGSEDSFLAFLANRKAHSSNLIKKENN